MSVTVTTSSTAVGVPLQVAAGTDFTIDENSNLVVVDSADNRVAGYAAGVWQSVTVTS